MMSSKSVVLAASILALAPVYGDGPQPPKRKKPIEYEYVDYPVKLVRVIQAGKHVVGSLDKHGEFFPYAIVENTPVINKPRKPNEPVYELRAPTLIKGILDKDGNFIPDLGSRIIRLEDYEYSKDAPRIYNLPGEFVPK